MRHICFLALVLFVVPLVAQSPEKREIFVSRIHDDVHIDGRMDESFWKESVPIRDFWQYFPDDSSTALAPTEIYMAYDADHLYIATRCFSDSNAFIVPSYRRDFRAGGNDNITFLIDPFNDGTNAFMFGTNPLGVQREGLISGGGSGLDGFSTSWDNKWRCEAVVHDTFWTAEMAIPFRTLRYRAGSRKWRFNSYRFDMQTNERSTWMRIPQNQWIFNLAYMGDMIWEEGLPSSGSNIALIPYATLGLTKDYESEEPTDFKYDIGGDAKIAITSGLNLDLTVNPDFSQVEVDRQITNLDRFEIFFPERRQFFLENADLFGSFGFQRINPFFSRRIGTAEDVANDETVQNRIYAGARLSGKVNDDWRIGLLNMHTASDDAIFLPSYNYTVAAMQRKIWSRSNIGFIFVNKQAINAKDNAQSDRYNRIAGLDFNLASADNTWSGKTFFHYAMTQADASEPYAHGFELAYEKPAFGARWQHEVVGADYDAQVGFVPRTDFISIAPALNYRFYPASGSVALHGPEFRSRFIWEPGFGKTDHFIAVGWTGQLRQFQRFELFANHEYVHLFDDFDPTGTDSTPLLAGTDYNFLNVTAFINTPMRKALSVSFRPFIGSYFNGFRMGLNGGVNFRYQPYGSVSIEYAFNHFDMPHLEETKQTFLIGPRIDVTFSKAVFLTTFVQYNSQTQNTNINARFQWRYAPVSDFFLVFTDNYFTGNVQPSDRFVFGIRNRAIVAKWTYWLNP